MILMMNLPDRYTKIHEKAHQKAGTKYIRIHDFRITG